MNNDIKISKRISLILRHNPQAANLTLDEHGWADVKKLIAAIGIDMETLERVVAENDKQRFSFNDSRTKIRANQGHSIQVELNLPETEPPDELYHGTASKNLDSIKNHGIQKQKRQHVHLSPDVETASKVGKRHGNPAVLIIDAKQMRADGHKFYLSANKVWLTDSVPWKYVKKLDYKEKA